MLFGYAYWVRDRVLDCAAKLSSAEFTVPSAITTRNLRGTLVHTLDVQSSWRARLQGRPETAWKGELAVADYPTVGILAERWRRDEDEMRRWLATLTDETLAKELRVEASPYPLWYYLLHVHTHTLQQLADAATLLTRMLHSPGNLEFLEYADDLVRRKTGVSS